VWKHVGDQHLLLTAFVDCINYNQMQGTNNIKFMRDIFIRNTHTPLLKQLQVIQFQTYEILKIYKKGKYEQRF